MELQERRLEVIIEQAYIKGFKHCATIMGVMKPYMSKSEAYKTYGRAKVDWWIKTGILQEQKDGDLTPGSKQSQNPRIA